MKYIFRRGGAVLVTCFLALLPWAVMAQASCEAQARAMLKRPPVYPENKDPLVFVGTVNAVRPLETKNDVESFDIEFTAQQWVRGPQQSPIIVRGFRETRLTYCPLPEQFVPQPGERWIIFGVMQDGKLSPNADYSVPVPDEKSLQSILKQLK